MQSVLSEALCRAGNGKDFGAREEVRLESTWICPYMEAMRESKRFDEMW